MDDGLHVVSQIPSIIIQLGCVLALVLFLLFGFFFLILHSQNSLVHFSVSRWLKV